MAGSPCPFAGSLLVCSQPYPLAASYKISTGDLTLTPSEGLKVDPALFVGNWTLNVSLFVRLLTAAVSTGATVVLSTSKGGAAPPGDVLTYLGAPKDVQSALGAPMEPFASFPVTTVP